MLYSLTFEIVWGFFEWLVVPPFFSQVSRAARGENRNQSASQSNYSTRRLLLSFTEGMSEEWEKLICATRVIEGKEDEPLAAHASESGRYKEGLSFYPLFPLDGRKCVFMFLFWCTLCKCLPWLKTFAVCTRRALTGIPWQIKFQQLTMVPPWLPVPSLPLALVSLQSQQNGQKSRVCQRLSCSSSQLGGLN